MREPRKPVNPLGKKNKKYLAKGKKSSKKTAKAEAKAAKSSKKAARAVLLEGRVCPCCKKHCPLANPKCSKGKAVRKKVLGDKS